MSLGTSNRDGGKTSESGHLRAIAKIVTGDVITGLNAVQRAAGVNMSVDVQIGDAFVRRSDGSYAHPVFNDAVYNQVISAADGSNPRRDIVVIYVDYGQTPSTAVSNNTNGVVKIKVVNGTPAGSPVDPNAAAIQASVGSGNPYSILARVRVPASQTTISNSLIDDLRTMISSNTDSVTTAAIQALAVTAAKIAAGAVDGTKLSTSAIYLGYAERTTNFVTALNGTTVTGLVQAVTVPAGGRGIEITVGAYNFQHSTAITNLELSVWDDTAGVKVGAVLGTIPGSNYSFPVALVVPLVGAKAPAAGSRTYSVRFGNGAANSTLSASSTAPAFISIKAV